MDGLQQMFQEFCCDLQTCEHINKVLYIKYTYMQCWAINFWLQIDNKI